jgi:hypothetical protein
MIDRAALRAAMEAATKVPPRAVNVPAWGADPIFIRALTVGEIEAQTADTESVDKKRIARGVVRIICDEKGERLFDPDNEADVDLISRQSWNTLRAVLDAANELNAVTPAAVENLGNGSPSAKSS